MWPNPNFLYSSSQHRNSKTEHNYLQLMQMNHDILFFFVALVLKTSSVEFFGQADMC